MKYILLYTVFCFVGRVTAQRKIDLENKFLSPHDSSFFKLPQTIPFSFRSKNLGPDTIFSGDSLRYRACLHSNCTDILFLRINKTIVPGDSLTYYDTLELKGESLNENIVRLKWSIVPFVYKVSPNNNKGNIDAGYDASRLDNNRDTVIIFFRKESSSINHGYLDKELALYPNPLINRTFNINSGGFDVVSIKVYNNLGKLVLFEKFQKSMFTVDVSAMTKGHYNCLIDFGENQYVTRKIIIQ